MAHLLQVEFYVVRTLLAGSVILIHIRKDYEFVVIIIFIIKTYQPMYSPYIVCLFDPVYVLRSNASDQTRTSLNLKIVVYEPLFMNDRGGFRCWRVKK